MILEKDGIAIEEITGHKIYLIRGYKEGDVIPAPYTQVMTAVIKDGELEIIGAVYTEKARMSQGRAFREFFKKLGFKEYTYESSDGEKLTRKVTSL